MLYTVKDIALDYDRGEEIIGTVEAETPEAAILAAITAISSPRYVAYMIRSNQARDLLAACVAEPA